MLGQGQLGEVLEAQQVRQLPRRPVQPQHVRGAVDVGDLVHLPEGELAKLLVGKIAARVARVGLDEFDRRLARAAAALAASSPVARRTANDARGPRWAGAVLRLDELGPVYADLASSRASVAMSSGCVNALKCSCASSARV